jgi:phosphate-selective porin OprO/OprP
MTDGFVMWSRHVGLTVRAGQFKTPFGHEQLTGDPVLFTIERSLANDRLTMSRQVGVQVAGALAQKRFNYALGLFNGNGVNNGVNDGEDFLYVARLTGVPAQGKVSG